LRILGSDTGFEISYLFQRSDRPEMNIGNTQLYAATIIATVEVAIYFWGYLNPTKADKSVASASSQNITTFGRKIIIDSQRMNNTA